MGQVLQEEGGRTDRGPSRAKLWRGWYGYVRIGDIEPKCVIDNLEYGCGTLTFSVGDGAGTRKVAFRPLYPDAEKEKVYETLYRRLEASIHTHGQLMPVLLWRINGKLYCRYGASRLHVMRKMGIDAVKALICDFDRESWDLANYVPIDSPMRCLETLGDPPVIGSFEFSHERLDFHNAFPGEWDPND